MSPLARQSGGRDAVWPPPLRPGDRIRVPAPASPVKLEFSDPGIEALRRRGYLAEIPGYAYGTFMYCSAPDAVRGADLADAFADGGAGCVWPARGGYGTGRLLSHLDAAFPLPPRRVKAVVGCSDLTFLLLYVLQRWGWVAFHGPMPAGDLGRGLADTQRLFAMLEGGAAPVEACAGPLEVVRDGPALSGPLTGGCLSVLVSTLGTPDEWLTDGRILFLEDTQTKPFQIDRMLTQLRLAGKFQNCRGMVFGRMTGCTQHPRQGYDIRDCIRHALDGVDTPVLFGLPSGHSDIPAVPLALGARYRLDPAQRNLFLEEPRPCPAL